MDYTHKLFRVWPSEESICLAPLEGFTPANRWPALEKVGTVFVYRIGKDRIQTPA